MYKIAHKDKKTKARIGTLKTAHGRIQTPFFMPVATKACAKHLDALDLKNIDTKAIICNAYLLYLKPGLETIEKFSSLHKFMNFNKVIFTDSGGFQMLDPYFLKKLDETGVHFTSPFDGKSHHFSPEKSILTQIRLKSDTAMCLDHVPRYGKKKSDYIDSLKRTTEWAKRCKKEKEQHKTKTLLFGITQGGTYKDLRVISTKQITELDFDGISIGGLCIGETEKETYNMIKTSYQYLPENKPRYIMGMGSPPHLVEAIAQGMDIFDSIYPTRNARHNTLFTFKGCIKKVIAAKHKDIKKPIDKECNCYVCKNFSLGYIHHLMKLKEQIGLRLASYHNLAFLQQLMQRCHQEIKENTFHKFKKEFLKNYKK